MRSPGCDREVDVLEMLQQARWPDSADPALAAHIGSCPACTDLLAVALPLLDEQRALVHDAPVPSSAIAWWRLQMRSRREAAEKAARPITVMHGVALACAAGLLATALGLFVPTFRRWFLELADGLSRLSLPAMADPLANPVLLAAVAATGLLALAVPVALYVALRED